MHLYLQLTRSLAVTLIWLYCNKLVLRYVRLRVSDLGQVSIPQPGIVTVSVNEELIIDVIKELYCNSAAGPDGVPVTLLKNHLLSLPSH